MLKEWTFYMENSLHYRVNSLHYRVNSLHYRVNTEQSKIGFFQLTVICFEFIGYFFKFFNWIASKSQIMGGFGKMFYNVPQSTLKWKCRDALSFDFTALTYSCFFCSLKHVHFKKHLFLALVLQRLLAKFTKFFCLRDCNV